MNKSFKVDKIVDCSGKVCPIPVIETAKAIKQIEVGQIMKTISTDHGSPPDMRAWSRNTKHELLDSDQEDDKFIFYIRRTH